MGKIDSQLFLQYLWEKKHIFLNDVNKPNSLDFISWWLFVEMIIKVEVKCIISKLYKCNL